ncbi:1-acyl-sn-glycerol-3-phosphate acyltransferase [Agaricicola taiwanensis]|uniref:1-acyl-sn-glycerol-3-phosphate acyltransferase n=1 Tax=Agaricicola taiwanensis TaxID=591372 RepID=A0A8J3DYX3_9RHOB|nr:lysophospholipid acyltransferase family protein [Agaricicola taiwanensis]GGE51095.1 1-acyl-sn-glycerol-3-phosphate acyltransferase [Agaricicola taiwanensis]
MFITVLRSLAFNIALYVAFLVISLLLSPVLLLPQRTVLRVAKIWASSSLWLLKVVAGVDIEVRGREHLPQGPFLVASKHQSALETIALVTLVPIPTFILKRELMWLPIFGWYLNRTGMISVDRGARAAALKSMTKYARRAIALDRQIIIFPEGTRRPVGAEPAYKWGVAHLYDALQVPCVPIALNTGLFWPRRTFLRHPGTAVIEILPPVAPGLPKEAFLAEISARIETASNALVAETQPS